MAAIENTVKHRMPRQLHHTIVSNPQSSRRRGTHASMSCENCTLHGSSKWLQVPGPSAMRYTESAQKTQKLAVAREAWTSRMTMAIM
jgi:hypothetical protein